MKNEQLSLYNQCKKPGETPHFFQSMLTIRNLYLTFENRDLKSLTTGNYSFISG